MKLITSIMLIISLTGCFAHGKMDHRTSIGGNIGPMRCLGMGDVIGVIKGKRGSSFGSCNLSSTR